jgi:2-dehydro-3-deoxyphosphogluconate aldolase/(4S)-4-hydroxy-2-oxoglutarate aldolase
MSRHSIVEIMKTSAVIPVLVIDRLEDAAPLARALVAGGLKVLEVTLRTPEGLAAIAEMKKAAPEAIVGAGTVNTAALLDQAADAGAEFIVAPGLTTALAEAARRRDLPFLPGVSSAGDILRGIELGLSAFKFFPAETSGGAAAIKALEGPFGGLDICPTGGVTLANAPNYLALNSVRCVGGSWIATKDLVRAGNWAEITRLAAEAAALKRS